VGWKWGNDLKCDGVNTYYLARLYQITLETPRVIAANEEQG